MSNIVFEVREPGQFESRGFYRSPDIMFGYLDKKELEAIGVLASHCGYIIEPDPEREPSKVKIYSADYTRWGFIRKLWNALPDLNGNFGSQLVYGFFSGKRFIAKYSINENFMNLIKHLSDDEPSDSLIGIRIKDLETGATRDQIIQLYDR
jgi:hypothetical protein